MFDRSPGLELVLLPDLQEISDFPCDVGSEPAALRGMVRGVGVEVDWGFVHEGWTSKVSMDMLEFNSPFVSGLILYTGWTICTHSRHCQNARSCCSTLAIRKTRERNRRGHPWCLLTLPHRRLGG